MSERMIDFSRAGSWQARIRPGKLKKLVTGELPYYISSKSKKPLKQQAAELRNLYRFYRCLPLQYFRHHMYERSFDGDIFDYLPHHYINRFIADANPLENRDKVSDKLTFELLMREIGVPATETLFLATQDRRIKDVDGAAVPYAKFASKIAGCGDAGYFVKPRLGVRALGAFPLWTENGVLRDSSGHIKDQDAFFDRVLQESRYGDILFQKRLVQHESLNRINPDCINTLRVVTFAHDEQVSLDGCMLSIGPALDGTDSWSRGAMIARVDPETGRLSKYAFRKYSHGSEVLERHPKTGFPFQEGQIPDWDLIKHYLTQGALALRPLTSLGWDIVLSTHGPVMLETNDDWDCYFCQEGMKGLKNSETGHSILANFKVGDYRL